jgi:membrane protease YdiL (CAAX protease family)
MKYWKKIPAIVRAILVGMAIQLSGIIPVFMLVQKNIEIMPNFPWALVAGAIYLWFFWHYLAGRTGIFKPSLERRNLSRTEKIDPANLGPMMITGFFLSVTLISFVFLGYMLTKVPLQQVEMLSALRTIPLWSSLSLLLLASVVTGFIEELAWRGYAQRTIERRHSMALAISVVALVFTIIHFLPLPIWPLFFFGSLGWGVLAYYSRSIIPGIVFHSLIDFVVFVWALFNLEQLETILNYDVFESGWSDLFITLLLTAITFGGITIYFFSRLRKIHCSRNDAHERSDDM